MALLARLHLSTNSVSRAALGHWMFPVGRFGAVHCGVCIQFCFAQGKLRLVILLLKHSLVILDTVNNMLAKISSFKTSSAKARWEQGLAWLGGGRVLWNQRQIGSAGLRAEGCLHGERIGQ